MSLTCFVWTFNFVRTFIIPSCATRLSSMLISIYVYLNNKIICLQCLRPTLYSKVCDNRALEFICKSSRGPITIHLKSVHINISFHFILSYWFYKYWFFRTAMKRNQLNGSILLAVICSTLLVFAEEVQNFDDTDDGVTIESEKIVSLLGLSFRRFCSLHISIIIYYCRITQNRHTKH